MDSNLINHLPPGKLTADVDQLFQDFDYLGILKNYGSYCLFINSLLSLALRKKQYQVKLIACYAQLDSNASQRFLLGHPAYIDPGQLAGHIACIVNDQYLIDFGLGNLRKFDSDFAQAVACPIHLNDDSSSSDSKCIASITTMSQQSLTWIGDHTIPDLELAIQAQEAKVMQLMSFIEQFQNNRLGHCIRKALTSKTKVSPKTKISTQSLNWPLKNFDDTLRP